MESPQKESSSQGEDIEPGRVEGVASVPTAVLSPSWSEHWLCKALYHSPNSVLEKDT